MNQWQLVKPDSPQRRAPTKPFKHRAERQPGARSPRSLIVVFCSALLIFNGGCTTTRTIDPQTGSAMTDELKAGDAVTLLLRDGRELELTFVESTAEHFVGQDPTNSSRRIPWQDVSGLQVSRTSAGRTVLLVLAVAGFVLGIAGAASSPY